MLEHICHHFTIRMHECGEGQLGSDVSFSSDGMRVDVLVAYWKQPNLYPIDVNTFVLLLTRMLHIAHHSSFMITRIFLQNRSCCQDFFHFDFHCTMFVRKRQGILISITVNHSAIFTPSLDMSSIEKSVTVCSLVRACDQS